MTEDSLQLGPGHVAAGLDGGVNPEPLALRQHVLGEFGLDRRLAAADGDPSPEFRKKTTSRRTVATTSSTVIRRPKTTRAPERHSSTHSRQPLHFAHGTSCVS